MSSDVEKYEELLRNMVDFRSSLEPCERCHFTGIIEGTWKLEEWSVCTRCKGFAVCTRKENDDG